MRIVGPTLLKAFHGTSRIFTQHFHFPADGIEDAHEAGESNRGHDIAVDNGVDTGEIIAQEPVIRSDGYFSKFRD